MNISAKFIPRRDTTQNWTTNNPVLLEGEIGIVTDAIEMKIGDGETAWNDLKFFYKRKDIANAYTQKTKLNCGAGLKFSIPVSDNSAYLFAPIEVLKFSSTESDSIVTACFYDNSDATSFNFDKDCVEFTGVMKLKRAEKILEFTTPTVFNNGYMCSATVDLSVFTELLDYLPPDFSKIADTWGTGYDTENHQWSQYSEVNDVTKTSIYVKNNIAYGVVDNTFSVLSNSWSSLSDSEKWDIFNSTTGEASKANLINLGAFTIYSYSTDIEVPEYKLVYIPLPQLILPKNTISLEGFELSNVNIVHEVTGNAEIKLAITTDLETYYTYNSTTGVFEALSGDISANLLLQEGTDISEISNIPTEAWKDTASIGFAYALSQTNESENCYTDELKLTLSGNGFWKKAVHGTDYDYSYNGSLVTFSILTSGDYKVNYISTSQNV